MPALVGSARLLANDWQMSEAAAQLEFAQEYDADYAEARLVKGQMLIAQKEFAAGRIELEEYLRSALRTPRRRNCSTCVPGENG